jgi:GDP-L-fucose synthase
MKTVLVCGGTGFIGRNVVERLARRSDIKLLATHFRRPAAPIAGVTWRRVDLTDAAQVDAAVQGVDVIVQAAATTSGAKDIVARPYIHVTDNAVMNSLLLRAAHDLGVSHFLFFSCSVMYPSAETPLKEEDFDAAAGIHPRYFGVGWTKVYIERMCEFYAGLGRTRHTVIRHSNVYGPHDKFDLERSHVFGATVTKVLNASDGKIVVWGRGAERRDLLYVDDLVDFVERAIAAQTTSFELVNVGIGDAMSVKDLVELIIRSAGKDVRIDFDLSKPTIDTRLCLDWSKARDLFGWSPATSLEDGVRRTLNWCRQNTAGHSSSTKD